MTEELRELLREMDIVVCSRYIGDVVSCGLLWVVASQKERVVIFVGVGLWVVLGVWSERSWNGRWS